MAPLLVSLLQPHCQIQKTAQSFRLDVVLDVLQYLVVVSQLYHRNGSLRQLCSLLLSQRAPLLLVGFTDPAFVGEDIALVTKLQPTAVGIDLLLTLRNSPNEFLVLDDVGGAGVVFEDVLQVLGKVGEYCWLYDDSALGDGLEEVGLGESAVIGEVEELEGFE